MKFVKYLTLLFVLLLLSTPALSQFRVGTVSNFNFGEFELIDDSVEGKITVSPTGGAPVLQNVRMFTSPQRCVMTFTKYQNGGYDVTLNPIGSSTLNHSSVSGAGMYVDSFTYYSNSGKPFNGLYNNVMSFSGQTGTITLYIGATLTIPPGSPGGTYSTPSALIVIFDAYFD